jgi:hypothetical protein
MKILPLLFFFLPSLSFRLVANKHLSLSSLASAKKEILQKTYSIQSEIKSKRPNHSLGVNMFLRYMELDVALYRVLQDYKMTKEEAGQLIEEIGWEIFESGVNISFAFSRLASSKLQRRVKLILDVMFLTLFTSPFNRKNLSAGDGLFFDVTSCPVALYFKEQGVPELTKYAACKLDHRMAQVWGVKLERSQTISEGSQFCDFRFKLVQINKPK